MTNNDELALKAEQCANILENIAGFEPDDIDGDDIDLRFDLDGMDTGCTVSIVEQCQDAADTLHALLAERDADKKRIGDMQAIVDAAEKLVRCKGRYHSEQNYRALAALFGVKTPDLPPLETEARTVSIKLPERCECCYSEQESALFDGIVEEYTEALKTACVEAGIKLDVGEQS